MTSGSPEDLALPIDTIVARQPHGSRCEVVVVVVVGAVGAVGVEGRRAVQQGGVEPSARGVLDNAGQHDAGSSAAPDRRALARATRSSTLRENKHISASMALDSPSSGTAGKGAAEALVGLCKVVGPTEVGPAAPAPPPSCCSR